MVLPLRGIDDLGLVGLFVLPFTHVQSRRQVTSQVRVNEVIS